MTFSGRFSLSVDDFGESGYNWKNRSVVRSLMHFGSGCHRKRFNEFLCWVSCRFYLQLNQAGEISNLFSRVYAKMKKKLLCSSIRENLVLG